MDLYCQGPPPQPLDPDLADTLSARLAELARRTALCGTLQHLLAQRGSWHRPRSCPPTWWSPGPAAYTAPTQILRCTPVLQIAEDVLLDAVQGGVAAAHAARGHGAAPRPGSAGRRTPCHQHQHQHQRG